MAEEIVIGKLVLDTGDLNQAQAETKRGIIELEAEQKKLKAATDNLTSANEQQLQTFISNETELKRLRGEYSANQKTVIELERAQKGLDAALKENIKTQDQAIANNKALAAARKQIDTTTVEGARAIADINSKIDSNNKLINDSSSALEQQKNNVGNYPQLMNSVGQAFGGATQQVIGFVQSGRDVISGFSEVAGAITNSTTNLIGFRNATVRSAEATKSLSDTGGVAASAVESIGQNAQEAGKGADAGTAGMWGLVKSSLAFIATPVGLILAAIALSLGILISVFKTFQPLVDKVEQVVAALGAALNVVKNTIVAVITGAKSLGEAFSSIGGDMEDAANRAAALTKSMQDLEDAQKSQEVITARNRAEINKLNVALKNRTLSEEERLRISDQIIAKEQEDFNQRKKIVDQEVKNAREAIAIKAQFTEEEIELLKRTGDATKELAESRGGNYDEEYDALNKARLKAIALEDEVTVNLEKQYSRRDKLEQDAAAKREAALAKQKAAQDKAFQEDIKNRRNAIDILKLEAEQSTLTADQRIANAKRVFELENDLAKRSLSGSDERKKLIENRQALSKEILAITEEQINKELEAQKKAFEENTKITQQQKDVEIQSANDLAAAQILLLDKRLLTEKDYAEQVKIINDGKNESIALANKTFDEAEKERKTLQLENEKALEEVAFQIRLQDIQDREGAEQEIRLALRAEEYAREQELLDEALANKDISQELFNQKKLLSDKKYAADTKKIDAEIAKQKRTTNIQMLNDSVGALTALFGESKALAIAQALINTYEGITAGVALGFPASIPAVAFATATGFAAVKNILNTNKGSSSSGSAGVSGSPVTTSGTGNFVNSAQTTTVATVTQPPVQNETVVSPPILIVETLLEVIEGRQIKINSD
jgi:hypothetical protein